MTSKLRFTNKDSHKRVIHEDKTVFNEYPALLTLLRSNEKLPPAACDECTFLRRDSTFNLWECILIPPARDLKDTSKPVCSMSDWRESASNEFTDFMRLHEKYRTANDIIHDILAYNQSRI